MNSNDVLMNKISALYDIVRYTSTVCPEEHIDKLYDMIVLIDVIVYQYTTRVLSSILPYFGKDNNSTKIYRKYSNYIELLNSYDTIGQLVDVYIESMVIVNKIISSGEFKKNVSYNSFLLRKYKKIDYIVSIKKLNDIFKNTDILEMEMRNEYTICSNCNKTMTTIPSESIIFCDLCGNMFKINGIQFDIPANAFSHIPINKYKQHNSKKHSLKWLNYIQANDDVPESVIDVLDVIAKKSFSINGELMNMSTLTCKQIREWLKETKMTNYNNSAPSIRKLITGRHGDAIIPPQLSSDEKELIINDIVNVLTIFPKVVNDKVLLRKLNKTRIKKKTYYPFMIMKLFCYRLRHSDKLFGLLQCIHFQSTSTLYQDDLLWEKICEMINVPYEITDITALQKYLN